MESARKTTLAEKVLASGPVVSVQSLSEFADVFRRKLRWDWSRVETALQAIVDTAHSVQSLTLDTQLLAVEIAKLTGYRIFDCQLLACAVEAGCDTFLSEDLQHGRVVKGVRIVNPFKI